jgi:hypothetical protein
MAQQRILVRRIDQQLELLCHDAGLFYARNTVLYDRKAQRKCLPGRVFRSFFRRHDAVIIAQ